MATIAQTQSLLDELACPAVASATQCRADAADALQAPGKASEQAGRKLRLVQGSFLAEPDANLRARGQALEQKYAAMRAYAERAQQCLRNLAVCSSEVDAAEQEFKAEAEKLGYTIPA